MAYFIRTAPTGQGTLIERKHSPMDSTYFTYRRVGGEYAHRWVRQGNIHETALYLDMDGRIRKAEAEREAPVRTQVFKQGPGADIEPGWYVVRYEGSGPLLSDKLAGPYRTKRAARAARRSL